MATTLEQKAQSACESTYEEVGVDAYNECYRRKLRALRTGQTAGQVFITLANMFRGGAQEAVPPAPEKKGMPPIAWVGIGLAVVGAGVAVFMLTRPKKK